MKKLIKAIYELVDQLHDLGVKLDGISQEIAEGNRQAQERWNKSEAR
jgi:hypothetical protein